MFSYLFGPAPVKTRLESTPQLKELIPSIKRIRFKQKELKKIVADDANNPAYLKSYLLTALLADIDAQTRIFNATRKIGIENADLLITVKFVKDLQKAVYTAVSEQSEHLNAKRNSNKSAAQTAMGTTLIAGSVAVGVATGSIIFGGGTLWLSRQLGISLSQLAGIDDDKTETMHILEEFTQKLDRIASALTVVLGSLKYTKDIQANFPLTCPILKTKIKTPALCALDNLIYEKSAITDHLKEHRKTPVVKKELRDKQRVEEVLSDNITLKDALDAYEKMILSESINLQSKSQSRNSTSETDDHLEADEWNSDDESNLNLVVRYVPARSSEPGTVESDEEKEDSRERHLRRKLN
jgi:hypothetical protein